MEEARTLMVEVPLQEWNRLIAIEERANVLERQVRYECRDKFRSSYLADVARIMGFDIPEFGYD